MASGPQQAKPVVESRRDRGRLERSDAAGRELEGEGEPVEPEADPGDGCCVLAGQGETGGDGSGTLDEEADCLGACQLCERRQLLGIGDFE